MNINDTKGIESVGRLGGPQTAHPAPVEAKRDRVTVEVGQEAAKVAAASPRPAVMNRAARLHELEAAIKSGRYHPDAGQLANDLLESAEIDARLMAMFRR
jgi:anti-sigma28 factor (negative regulator of flagellin synthesis)